MTEPTPVTLGDALDWLHEQGKRRIDAVRGSDALDWLHEQGKRRADAVPEFDVEETLLMMRAASELQRIGQRQGSPDAGITADALLPEVVPAPEALTSQARPASAAWDGSEILTEVYRGHYNQLVRLALLLVHDVPTAEEVVQDAFEALHGARHRLRDTEKALSYLQQAIVNRSRSVLRHRKLVDMHPHKTAPDEQSAEDAALALIEPSALTSALRSLPARQREAIVLRYYWDLSEGDIAQAMGISQGAVKSHTTRAMAALKSILEHEA